jgi:transcription antitermination factor NusG
MNTLYNIGDFVGHVDRPVMVAPMPKLWYLLRLHPNYELKAERQLLEAGVSVYVPKEKRLLKTVWGRRAMRELPVFSGVMFVPDFEADLARLKQLASGLGGFVRCGEAPLTISLLWMEKIRKFEERMQSVAGHRKFRVNQQVRIVGGQFDMWEAMVERLDSHHRLRVLINILERKVPVMLDEDQIEAV